MPLGLAKIDQASGRVLAFPRVVRPVRSLAYCKANPSISSRQMALPLHMIDGGWRINSVSRETGKFLWRHILGGLHYRFRTSSHWRVFV